MSYTLIDGEMESRAHPDTFEVPDAETINSLKIGDNVKIGVRFAPTSANSDSELYWGWRAKVGHAADNTAGERFWVRIIEIGPTDLYGMVNNDLVYTHCHGLTYKQEITFQRKHILAKLG